MKSQAKVLEAAGNLRINNQATAPRRQGDKSPHGPPVRRLQDNCRRDAAIIRRIIVWYPFCKSWAKGLEATGSNSAYEAGRQFSCHPPLRPVVGEPQRVRAHRQTKTRLVA